MNFAAPYLICNIPRHVDNLLSHHEEHVLHDDIVGYFQVPTVVWNKYFLSIAIGKRRFYFTKLPKFRAEVQKNILNHIACVERKYGDKIQSLHADSALELKHEKTSWKAWISNLQYLHATLLHPMDFLSAMIVLLLTRRENSWFNRATIPYWDEAVFHDTHLHNVTVCEAIGNKTP